MTTSNCTRNQRSILIVDDDEDELFLTRRMLEKAAVTNPIVAVNGGAKAIAHLRTCGLEQGGKGAGCPALVLLDLNMPDVDGFAVLRWLRSQTVFGDVRVIMLTSCDDPEAVRKCSQLGAAGFWVKHPAPDSIAFEISQILKEASSSVDSSPLVQ